MHSPDIIISTFHLYLTASKANKTDFRAVMVMQRIPAHSRAPFLTFGNDIKLQRFAT